MNIIHRIFANFRDHHWNFSQIKIFIIGISTNKRSGPEGFTGKFYQIFSTYYFQTIPKKENTLKLI